MATETIREQEVLLYGQRFPIKGLIRDSLVSVFPGKVVQGDPSRADDPLASSYVMSDWVGGSLRKYMNPQVDIDRYYHSSASTWTSRQLTLGPAVRDLGSAGLTDKHVRCGADYAGNLYVCFDDRLVRVNSDESLTIIGTLSSTATDIVVYKLLTGASAGTDILVIACGAGNINYYNGTTLTTSGAGTGKQYLAVWDDKLFSITNTGVLASTSDITAASGGWANVSSGLRLATNSATGLHIYPNASGEDALHVATTRGLYFYDESVDKIRPTRLQLPEQPLAGTATAVWRDDLYFAGGNLAVDRWTGTTISQAGLNRDEGLPQDLRGMITSLAPSVNYLFASVENLAVSPLGDPIFGWSQSLGAYGPYYGAAMSEQAGIAAIMIRTGSGWHTWYQSNSVGTGSKWVGVTSTSPSYRLAYGMDNKLFVSDLYPDVINSLENTLQGYRDTAEHVTPWNDMGWSEIDKLGLTVHLKAQHLDDPGHTATIDVYYGLDRNDENWTLLTTMSANEPEPVRIGGVNGVQFKSIRFKFVLHRDPTDQGHTPVLEFATLVFLKSIKARWSYTFTVDCSDQYAGLWPEELEDKLKSIADPDREGELLGDFVGWVSGKLVSRKVKLTSLSGQVLSGPDMRGLYQVSVVSL